jgi:hypothetical protein
MQRSKGIIPPCLSVRIAILIIGYRAKWQKGKGAIPNVALLPSSHLAPIPSSLQRL